MAASADGRGARGGPAFRGERADQLRGALADALAITTGLTARRSEVSGCCIASSCALHRPSRFQGQKGRGFTYVRIGTPLLLVRKLRRMAGKIHMPACSSTRYREIAERCRIDARSRGGPAAADLRDMADRYDALANVLDVRSRARG